MQILVRPDLARKEDGLPGVSEEDMKYVNSVYAKAAQQAQIGTLRSPSRGAGSSSDSYVIGSRVGTVQSRSGTAGSRVGNVNVNRGSNDAIGTPDVGIRMVKGTGKASGSLLAKDGSSQADLFEGIKYYVTLI